MIVSVRSSVRPAEIMVAICLLMTARSLSPTPFRRKERSISRFSPVPAWASVTEMGETPMVRSRELTADSVAASTVPLTSLPVASRPRYA
jgi:hypothetical protein